MIQGQTYRLIPSTYSLSNTQYMTITNANDALSNTDSTSYATVTHTSKSTTSYFLYLSGFNFNTVPNDVDIISFAIKIKAYESGLSTSANYSPKIQNNNTTLTGTCSAINTTARVLQFTGVTATFDTIKSYGNNFRLQLYVRRSNRYTQGYLYVYGAEIEVVTGNKYEINVTSNSASSITVPSYQTVSEYSSTTLTFNNVTDIATLAFIDNGVNVTNKLINTSGNTYTYTIDNINEDHNIVINDVPAYNVTVTENDPNNIFSVSPLGVTRIGKGSDIEITITTDDRDSILIYDNNENVSQSLVPGKELSNTINEDSFGLSQYESGTLSITGTNYSAANGANSSSNTASHARFYTATTGTLLDAVYAFNVNIPNDAEIVSVSCTVRGYCYNGSSYYTTRTVQLYAGNVPMGSAYTFPTSNGTFNLNCGDWTAEQLSNCKLKILCNSTSTSTSYNIRFYGATLIVQYKEYIDSDTISVYTISNIGAEHNVVINEAPYKLISGTSSFTGKGFSNLPKKIYVNGESFIVSLSGISNRYSFRLSDNGNDVTSSVNVTNYQYTISNITADHELLITEAPKYAVSGTSNFTGKSITGTGNVYHGDSITVTLTNITNAKSFKLYDNNVDVTSSVNTTNWQYTLTNVTTAHTLRIEEAPYYSISLTSNFDGKSLVPSSGFDPNKVYEGDSIVIEIQYNPDNLSFTLLDNNVDVTNDVDPDIYYYTLNNVQGNHTLVLNENPYYLISSEVGTLSGAGFTGIPKKYYYGSSYIVTVTLTGISNSKSFKLYDNNVDVTADVNTSTYKYYLSNISANHILRIDEATKYTVTGTSNLSGAGFSGLGNVYQGDNITITLTGIVNTFSFKLYDNDTDVTSSVNTSNWRYTISNAQGTHELRIEEATYYAVTATVTYPNTSITGTSNKVYEGDSITVTLTGISDRDSFRLYDNGFVATDSVNSSYQYTISNIQTDHELVLEEIPHYSVTEGNSTLSGATLTGLTNKVYAGSDVTVTIEGVSDSYSIKLTDNGVDVSDKVIMPTAASEPTYTVETASDASYGFNLNTGTGYYTSANTGTNKSAGVCVVNFDLPVLCRITIEYINYAEESYDFGVFGNIDSILSNDYYAAGSGGAIITDTDYKLACNTSTYNVSTVQTLTYDIPAGQHYIYVKYSKDDATASNNDSLQFKIASIEPLAVITSVPEYIITDISENHVLVVSLQDTITVTTSSSYNGASLSPASSTVYKGEPIELTLTVSDISLVSVRVTNSKNSMVTGIFTDNGNGTYTGILTVRENSTVTVIQKVTYTITCTDNATNGNITPTGSQSIDGGYDAEYIIESDHFDRIYLKDNNVIVNDLIERHYTSQTTVTFVPSEYDSVNSNPAGIDSTNVAANGLTNADSTTRATFTTNTTANSETNIYYNFDCSSIPVNAVIDNVTCEFKATISSNYFNTRIGQLCYGTTKKGSPTTVTNTSVNQTVNKQTIADCGTWTREELNNIKILIQGIRGTSTSAFSNSFFGASLSITYHVDYYGYTIENVSAAHTLVLSDRPTYQITASSSTNKATILPASSTIYEANDITFEITTSDIHKIKLLDNNVDVTTDISIVSGNYVYEIENVTVAHTLLIKNKLTIFLKQLNAWTEYSKIYKKINNEWFEQDEMEGLFDINKIYILK